MSISTATADEPAQLLLSADTLSADSRSATIEGVLKHLRENYVFPDVALKMEKSVRERIETKEYDGITRGEDLARALTADLREVSHDSHLVVSYSPETRVRSPATEPTPEEEVNRIRQGAAVNFGFKKVERLTGNVGYLDLDGFWRPTEAAEATAAAMTFVANTDALIVDLRSNGGGNPGMVALLCSYLVADQPIHLWDEHARPDAVVHPVWSLPYVTGRRYLDKDVFLLTSHRTYSAAEGFAYTLKNLKRATVVGEATGGGAHPGAAQFVDEHFSVFVPMGRVVSPITNTDWEGTGVKPDIDVPAELAPLTAHLEALKKQSQRWKDDPEALAQLARMKQRVEQELHDLKEKRAK